MNLLLSFCLVLQACECERLKLSVRMLQEELRKHKNMLDTGIQYFSTLFLITLVEFIVIQFYFVQKQSQLADLLPLCKFSRITIFHFIRNLLFSQSVNTKIFP